MNFHWGYKITAVLGLFILLMSGMLVMSLQYKNELVNEDYYAREMLVQGRIEAAGNFAEAEFDVAISGEGNQVKVVFRNLPEGSTPIGKLMLYKPDDASGDAQYELLLGADNEMVVAPPKSVGRYKASLAFSIGGLTYYTEKHLSL